MLGRRLMALGAVLILCALGLTAYNHWDDRRAQREVARLLEELKAAEPAESGAGDRGLVRVWGALRPRQARRGYSGVEL